jgi:hypothetical protein
MQSEELFFKSEDDIQKEYKQKIFLKTLKEGRTPKRKCLFKNIFYLSHVYRALRRIDSVTVTNDPKYNRKYVLSLDGLFPKKRKDLLNDERLINSFKRYLINYRIGTDLCFTYQETLSIYFNYNEVRWDLIDHDLITYHPDNITRHKTNDFVYVKNYNLRLK